MNYVEHFRCAEQPGVVNQEKERRLAALEADITMCRHLLQENIRRIDEMLTMIEEILLRPAPPAPTNTPPSKGETLAAAVRAQRVADGYGR